MSRTSDLKDAQALQRARIIRYLAWNNDRTSSEIATALGMSPQVVGQILHKGDEFRETSKGRWRGVR